MATKDFEGKSGFVNSNENYGFQYKNFISLNKKYKKENLIQAYKCSLIDSIQVERKNIDESDPYQTKRNKNYLWKNENELKPYLTQFASEEKSQKCWKNENVTSANANRALSLHITAYENFIEASNSDNFETKENKSRKENKNEKTWKNVKQIFARTFASSFEIPRQKEDQIMSEPEIMQFKATQKLLDPNQLNFVEKSSGFDKSKDSNLKSKWNSSNASKTSIQSMKFKSKNGFSTTVFEVDPNLETTPSLDFCGRFLKLKTLNSPYLANYVEFTRLASDSCKIALTTEHPRGMPLSAILPSLNQKDKYEITFHLLNALRYLHSEGVTVGHLLPQNIIVDISSRSCSVKLIHYGSMYLFGKNIFDNIYNIFTLTPERIMKICSTQKASDLFALGILLVCIQMGVDIHSEYSFSKYWQSFTNILLQLSDPFCDISMGDKLDLLLQNSYDSKNQSKDSTIHSVIRNLLKINPSQRPHLTTVLSLFDPKPKQQIITNDFPADIQLHLWKLCGKSIERNLIESKFIHVSASIVMLSYGHPISRFIKTNDNNKKHVKSHNKVFIQPDENFHEASRAAKEYLDHKNILRYRSGCNEFERCRSAMTFTSQFERFVAFYEDVYHGRKALSADTPNSIRAKIWARRLTPKGLPNYLFYVSNNSLAKSCKHQLSLDLPRCHQYDESMTSAQIQSKVTALIEKILAVSPDSSAYWQGLDSLIAPFAILYANDLENGFGVVFEIIQRFTPEYFTRLSSHALEESLRTFSRLISFANSRLACFLRVNGLSPSTYAVPWLLTCYAHVFAFDKLFRIFDRMLDRDASYPLAIGISILEICAIDLMDAIRGDEAFKVLSNVSDIDITKLLTYSDRFDENIPATCFYRKYAEPPRRAPNLTVKYSESEDNELLVPKIHPEDFYQYFGRNDAILVVCNGESKHPQVISIPSNGFNETIENIIRKKQEENKVVGVISDDELLTIKTANEITDCSIDRVCVVDSSWMSFQWNHNL